MGLENLWKKCKKRFWSKKCLVQKIWVQNDFGPKKFWVQRNLKFKEVWVQKICLKKNYHEKELFKDL